MAKFHYKELLSELRKKAFAPIYILMVVAFLVVACGAYYLGKISNKPAIPSQVPFEQNNQAEIDKLNRRIQEKDKYINLLMQEVSTGKLTRTYKSIYSFEEFGVYSPLFENKEVENVVFSFRNEIITSKTIALETDQYKNSKARIVVWEYTSRKNTANDLKKLYVIFGGYENYNNNPILINHENLESYTNQEGLESYANIKDLRMYWGYNNCPKQICLVTLSFFTRYSPSGHPIYVQIGVNTSDFADSVTSPVVGKTKDKLKGIADTVETTLNH